MRLTDIRTCTSSLYISTYDQIVPLFNTSQTVATLGVSLFVMGLGLGPMVCHSRSTTSYRTDWQLRTASSSSLRVLWPPAHIYCFIHILCHLVDSLCIGKQPGYSTCREVLEWRFWKCIPFSCWRNRRRRFLQAGIVHANDGLYRIPIHWVSLPISLPHQFMFKNCLGFLHSYVIVMI